MISCDPEPLAAFVHDLQIEECEVHLYDGPKAFGCLLTEENYRFAIQRFGTNDLYFLAGVRPGMTARAADADIVKRGMFTLDFDVRKALIKRGEEPIEEKMLSTMEKILNELTEHSPWGNFRYAVHSGNGLHVHYFGTPVPMEEDVWSAGMREIFEEISSFTTIPADTCMQNAGRIARMPGSWNIKGEENRKLWKPVYFLRWNKDATVGDLRLVMEKGAARTKREESTKEVQRKAFEDRKGTGGDLFTIINEIPIEQVVHQLPLGCPNEKRKRDGGIHFYDAKWGMAAFFKHKEHNVIIHGGTSHFAPPVGKGYTCLGLVRTVLGCTTREAIAWFAEQSVRVREEMEREKKEWIQEQRRQEADTFLRSLSSVAV